MDKNALNNKDFAVLFAGPVDVALVMQQGSKNNLVQNEKERQKRY